MAFATLSKGVDEGGGGGGGACTMNTKLISLGYCNNHQNVSITRTIVKMQDYQDEHKINDLVNHMSMK